MTERLAERDAYLARLGLEAEPPSVDALFRIHRAHVERVPYETLWIQLGEVRTIDVAESVRWVATRRRGGYCFHLNGALSALLGDLGYSVTRHVGGVHRGDGPAESDLTNHLVLTVDGLPSESNPGGAWYIDAGLGDALHEPLPLRAGTSRQGPLELTLDETPEGVADWNLTHDPLGSFAGMGWRSAPARIDEFAERHAELSTSPESGFVRWLTVQRRDATGIDILRGLSLRRVGDGADESAIASSAELVAVMGDLFGLDVAPISSAALDRLWARVNAAHEAWLERADAATG